LDNRTETGDSSIYRTGAIHTIPVIFREICDKHFSAELQKTVILDTGTHLEDYSNGVINLISDIFFRRLLCDYFLKRHPIVGKEQCKYVTNYLKVK
jgi:hypothetical protein